MLLEHSVFLEININKEKGTLKGLVVKEKLVSLPLAITFMNIKFIKLLQV